MRPPKELRSDELISEIRRIHNSEKERNRTPNQQELEDVFIVGSARYLREFKPYHSDLDMVAAVRGVNSKDVSNSITPTITELEWSNIVASSGLPIKSEEGIVDFAVYHKSQISEKIEDNVVYSLGNDQYIHI